jgi:hypothetical protein
VIFRQAHESYNAASLRAVSAWISTMIYYGLRKINWVSRCHLRLTYRAVFTPSRLLFPHRHAATFVPMRHRHHRLPKMTSSSAKKALVLLHTTPARYHFTRQYVLANLLFRIRALYLFDRISIFCRENYHLLLFAKRKYRPFPYQNAQTTIPPLIMRDTSECH